MKFSYQSKLIKIQSNQKTKIKKITDEYFILLKMNELKINYNKNIYLN